MAGSSFSISFPGDVHSSEAKQSTSYPKLLFSKFIKLIQFIPFSREYKILKLSYCTVEKQWIKQDYLDFILKLCQLLRYITIFSNILYPTSILISVSSVPMLHIHIIHAPPSMNISSLSMHLKPLLCPTKTVIKPIKIIHINTTQNKDTHQVTHHRLSPLWITYQISWRTTMSPQHFTMSIKT